MKHLATISLVLFSILAFADHPKPHPVSVLTVKHDMFYFKVDKSFRGATVEVYSSKGELVHSDIVIHHRTLIDFYGQNAGTYTIKIRKDTNEVDLQYNKVGPAEPDPERPALVKLLR